MACVTAVPIATFGFYLTLHGHLTPGGGFAGGAVLATITALLLVSFGTGVIRSLRIRGFSIRKLMMEDGIMVFGLIVLVSLSSTFLHQALTKSGWFPGTSVPYGPNPGFLLTGGIIPLMNLVVGLEVLVGLSLAVVLLVVISKEGSGKPAEKASGGDRG
jgi:multicomponent Na+:H+ antiporter subunit B